MFRPLVNATINLHDQAQFVAIEVHNVLPDRMLPPKLPAMQSAVAKHLPEHEFGGCKRPTK
jgi:hypothetical protein